jgi:cysteinyl-tRNA synthetase
MLKLYNSLGRKVQEFRPIKPGEVKMYTCGPTVWNSPHIGNYRTFVFYDLLRRYLKFKGLKVTHVMNITDVEDRIIKGINQSGKTLKELTSFLEKSFHEDLSTLGVEEAEFNPHPTKHVDDIVRLITVLMDKGFGYKAEDGSVYFDVSKFKAYGALSGIDRGSLRPGGRVSSDHYEEKKEAIDFALWKAWAPDDGEVYWETSLGKGRPGWHIECSAMSMKYLGEFFDLHAGGMDLKFPHHENEIAQSESATSKKFVNFWLHSEMLSISGEGTHKSVGNVVYLRDLLRDGWEPLTIRLYLISPRYRDPMDLTIAGLQQARSERLRLQELVDRLGSVEGDSRAGSALADELLSDFEISMDDDLNTPRALAALFDFVRKANSSLDKASLGKEGATKLLDAMRRVNDVLGILSFAKEELPPKLAEMIALRDRARERRDFAESDRLRKELLSEGIIVEDTPTGTRWKRRPGG